MEHNKKLDKDMLILGYVKNCIACYGLKDFYTRSAKKHLMNSICIDGSEKSLMKALGFLDESFDVMSILKESVTQEVLDDLKATRDMIKAVRLFLCGVPKTIQSSIGEKLKQGLVATGEIKKDTIGLVDEYIVFDDNLEESVFNLGECKLYTPLKQVSWNVSLALILSEHQTAQNLIKNYMEQLNISAGDLLFLDIANCPSTELILAMSEYLNTPLVYLLPDVICCDSLKGLPYLVEVNGTHLVLSDITGEKDITYGHIPASMLDSALASGNLTDAILVDEHTLKVKKSC